MPLASAAFLEGVFGQATRTRAACCTAGALVILDPEERHSLRSLDDARLLLMLAPGPALERHTVGKEGRGEHLPATAEPLEAPTDRRVGGIQ